MSGSLSCTWMLHPIQRPKLRSVQTEFSSTAANWLSFPLLHQLHVLTPLFYLSDFLSWCAVQRSQCWVTSPLVYVALPNPQGRLAPVPLLQLRYSARHFVCIFIKLPSIYDQEHVFQSTFYQSWVIIWGSRKSNMVSFQLWICSWSHVADSHRKWQWTFYKSRGSCGLAAGILGIGKLQLRVLCHCAEI